MPTLSWDGKDAAVTAKDNISARLLNFDAALGYGDTNSGNIIVQGDNLDALKSLLPFYRASVKCIYIDPPYNTGAAFEHYNDNFPHAAWLSMMYPRLQLLREFLSDDGSIWISIDDDEAHYLKMVCDEIFGRNNFVGNVVWHKKGTRSNDARWFSDNHDFILVYAVDKFNWRMNLLPRSAESLKNYSNPDNDPRGVWASGPCHAKTPNEKDFYEITTPSGRKLFPPTGTSWRFSKENFQRLIDDNRIWFGKNGNNVPRVKRFFTEVQDGFVPTTLWLRDETGDNQEAKREVKAFNADEIFATPKPERLIERILTLATNEGDIVLDAFLGSGTTAAVAHKMKRRYIGVEIGEQVISHVVPRLRKVIDGEQGGISKSVGWQGGGGFSFYRLGEKLKTEDGTLNPAVTFDALAAQIWFSVTSTAYTVQANSPLLGVHNGTAIYLLYGDEDILTKQTLSTLPTYDGEKIIYGAACRIDKDFLRDNKITFKQLPQSLNLD